MFRDWKRVRTVSDYISKFQNVMLSVQLLSDDENMYRFIEGRKP